MATKSKESKNSTDSVHDVKIEVIDYSLQIDKLRESEPHSNTNKYIASLIKEATEKTRREVYSSGFWNGLVIGVIVAFIFWTILTFR